MDAEYAANEAVLPAYFLLYPLAVRSLDLSGYDLVISSSSGYAKGVRTGPGRDSCLLLPHAHAVGLEF